MFKKEECSVMKEIARTEEAIKSTYKRIDALQAKLQEENVPESKQKLIRVELDEVRKLLATNEDKLAHLRTHNRQTFVFTVALLFICFTVYMLYILVNGKDF